MELRDDEWPPKLKEILKHRKDTDSSKIHVFPLSDSKKVIYEGSVDDCPNEVLETRMQGWLKHDGIYIADM